MDQQRKLQDRPTRKKLKITRCLGFYVLIILLSFTAQRSFALSMTWSFVSSGGANCAHFFEHAEPAEHGWSDNWLCADRDIGLQFSESGPISGKQCVLLDEPSDPDTWGDNFLCWTDPSVDIKFTTTDVLPSEYSCLNVDEPSDPLGTWNDNHICYRKLTECQVLEPECPTCSSFPSGSDLTRFQSQEIVFKGSDLKSSMGHIAGSDLVYNGAATDGWLLYGPYLNNSGSQVRIYGSVVISTDWSPDAYETCSYRDFRDKCRGWDLHHYDTGFTVDYALGPKAHSMGAMQKRNLNNVNRLTINLPGLKCDGPVSGVEIRIRGLFGGLTNFTIHESRIITLWTK